VTSSRVVYTAITSGHAQLSLHPEIPDTDFICFSDVLLDRDDWQFRSIEAPAHLSPRMRAKYHKMFPPAGYAWNVWVDGAYVMSTDVAAVRLVDDLIEQSPSGFGLHRHHWYDCLYAEAAHAQELPKCASLREIIEEQVRHYEEAGHPRNWGLWAGGLLCRDDSACVAEIMRRWWEENLRWSWRDQLSLPFVLRSMGTRPDEWPWPLFNYPHVPAWKWNPG
jgi:hypothetical protein